MTRKLAIFASGSGSNARCILEHFHTTPGVDVAVVCSNKAAAGALDHARDFDVPRLVFDRDQLQTDLATTLQKMGVEVVVLAGFLWKIPESLLAAFPERIVNIHPSLLPDFGGKGMYGMHVHRAVKAAGKTQSGMTIHVIDREFDRGTILFQAQTELDPQDSPEDIAQKVLALEHAHYPKVLADWMSHLPQANS